METCRGQGEGGVNLCVPPTTYRVCGGGAGTHLADAALEGGVGGGLQGGLHAPQVERGAQVEPLALAG